MYNIPAVLIFLCQNILPDHLWTIISPPTITAIINICDHMIIQMGRIVCSSCRSSKICYCKRKGGIRLLLIFQAPFWQNSRPAVIKQQTPHLRQSNKLNIYQNLIIVVNNRKWVVICRIMMKMMFLVLLFKRREVIC